jgi:hypothetical protein
LQNQEAFEKEAKPLAKVDKRNDDAVRGIPLPSQINMAALQDKKKELDMRQMEWNTQRRNRILLNMHLQLQNMQRVLDRVEQCAKTYTTVYDEEHNLWKSVYQQEKQIEECNELINEFVAEGVSEIEFSNKQKRTEEDNIIDLVTYTVPMPKEIAIEIEEDVKSSSDYEDSTFSRKHSVTTTTTTKTGSIEQV